jgi:ribulose-phosphate 3-epimerase
MALSVEVVPAILVKDRAELVRRIELVKPHVRAVQIDVMDGVFVPNKTVGLPDFHDLPPGIKYEFHWMVQNPEDWILDVEGQHLHLVHVESVMDWHKVRDVVARSGSELGIVFNPPTPVSSLARYIGDAGQVLAMTVNPGFDGQKYIPEVESKITELRERYPELKIEVDGGINVQTAERAANAGANILDAASAVFSAPDAKLAIESIKKAGEKGFARWKA